MTDMGNNSVAMLRSYADRLVRLHEERDGLADDIADLLNEAKGAGFDKAALKEVVKIAREDKTKRAAREDRSALVALYCEHLGV